MVLSDPPLRGSKWKACILGYNTKRETLLQVRTKHLESLQRLLAR
jgi:hypothetical protein